MGARILGISGSRRRGSFNAQLLAAAAAELARRGAAVTTLDWDQVSLPLYDGDLEGECGPPAAAVRFKRLIADHDGLLIAAPEYNGSITPLLKNAIDWASRPGGPDRVFRTRPVALLSASPGRLGGCRGLNHLRDVLGNMGADVLPGQFSLGKAGQILAYGPLPAEVAHSLAAVTGDLVEAIHHRQRLPAESAGHASVLQ